MNNRFHKSQKNISSLNPANSYVIVDSKEFARPQSISLETIGDVLQLKIDDIFLERINVISLEVEDQEKSPQLPPETFKISSTLHLASDENYLYVWIPKLARWKRLLLSEWSSLDT